MSAPERHGPPILFVDLDGTVRHGLAELGHFVNHPDDVVIFPEAIERMQAWRGFDPLRAGETEFRPAGVVIGITNQAGVAAGHITEAMCAEITETTIMRCGGQLDQVITCPHGTDMACWCRKPLPGLIFGALEWYAAYLGHPGAPLRRDCLMVGDLDTDRQAARAAGVRFQHATDWRAGRPWTSCCEGSGIAQDTLPYLLPCPNPTCLARPS